MRPAALFVSYESAGYLRILSDSEMPRVMRKWPSFRDFALYKLGEASSPATRPAGNLISRRGRLHLPSGRWPTTPAHGARRQSASSASLNCIAGQCNLSAC